MDDERDKQQKRGTTDATAFRHESGMGFAILAMLLSSCAPPAQGAGGQATGSRQPIRGLAGLNQQFTMADNKDCGGYRALSGTGDIMNWSGDCKDGLLSGFGTQMWLTAKTLDGKYDARYVTAIVEGTFDRSRLQGTARVNMPSGYFDGRWENGVFVAAVDTNSPPVANQTPPAPPAPPQEMADRPPAPASPDPVPSPTMVAQTSGKTYGLGDLSDINDAYFKNRPKFSRLYEGQPFAFVGSFNSKKEMNDISQGYVVEFVVWGSGDDRTYLACISVNDETTIDRVNKWAASAGSRGKRVRVQGTIFDVAVQLIFPTIRLVDCTMREQ